MNYSCTFSEDKTMFTCKIEKNVIEENIIENFEDGLPIENFSLCSYRCPEGKKWNESLQKCI